MVIIVFIGPPGSGKTTQMYMLSRVLSNRGERNNILCLKRGLLATFLERVLVILIYGKESQHLYPMEILLRGAKDKLKRIVSLWYTINTFEIVIRLLILMVINKIFKRFLLIEEYIPAIIIDYLYVALRIKTPITAIKRNIDILVRFFLKVYPLRMIILTASIQELIHRWRKRGRAEYSRAYIFIQRILFTLIEILVHHPNKDILIIDTTNKSIYNTLKILVQNIYVQR